MPAYSMVHGGELHWFEQQFPQARRPWLDLSTGINPFAYPFDDLPSHSWRRLPESDEIHALVNAASLAYDVAPSQIIPGPGAQALIGALPWVREGDFVHILGPTYGGYAASWKATGKKTIFCHTVDDFYPITPQKTCVICRPNNPNGVCVGRDHIRELADALALSDGLLIVDESFADFSEDSICALLPHPAIVILRSFGKAYGLAAVRLGFALGQHPVMRALQSIFGPWPVNSAALAFGSQGLSDPKWLSETKARLLRETSSFHEEIAGYDALTLKGATPLFSFFLSHDARRLWLHLAEHGIATRCFDAMPQFLRFGLPVTGVVRERFFSALKSYKEA